MSVWVSMLRWLCAVTYYYASFIDEVSVSAVVVCVTWNSSFPPPPNKWCPTMLFVEKWNNASTSVLGLATEIWRNNGHYDPRQLWSVAIVSSMESIECIYLKATTCVEKLQMSGNLVTIGEISGNWPYFGNVGGKLFCGENSLLLTLCLGFSRNALYKSTLYITLHLLCC